MYNWLYTYGFYFAVYVRIAQLQHASLRAFVLDASLLPRAGAGPSEQPLTSHPSPYRVALLNTTHTSMGINRSGPVAHMRRAALDDEAAPVKKTKSVSVTSIFKQHRPKTKESGVIPQINLIAPSSTTKGASAGKVKPTKQPSTSHNPHKSSSRVLKKRSEAHPFVTEFKGMLLTMLAITVLTRRVYRGK
jgi:hypothetical protein